jgi:hypothetical protein
MKPYLIGAAIVMLACAAVWYYKETIDSTVNQHVHEIGETIQSQKN